MGLLIIFVSFDVNKGLISITELSA